MTPVGRMVLDRNPDNFFAETEQVAFGVQNLVPGIDFSQRPAAGRAHPLVLRHAAPAAGRAQLPRDPDQRAARAGAQQPARRLPPPGDPSRPRRLRAQLARRRLSVPGRGGRLHAASRSRSTATRCGQAGEVRRPLLAGHAVLEQPDAVREGAHRARLPLRAHEGPGAGDPRAHGLDAAQRLRRARAGGGRRARHPAAQAHARARSSRRRSEVERSPALSLTARPGRRQHPRTQDRDPDGARRRCRLGHEDARRDPGQGRAPWCGWWRRASARVDSGRRRRRSSPTRRSRPCPRSLFDAVVVPDGERGRGRPAPRSARRSSSSRTSTATASRS